MNAFNTILVPTDFSAFADHALAYARAFAKQTGGAVHAVHVVNARAVEGGGLEGIYMNQGELDESLQAVKEHAEAKMEHVVLKDHLLGVEVTPHVLVGSPAKDIAALASEIGADLIVIATHGRSGLDRRVLGSTCDKLIRTSPVPVLVVKHPEQEFVTAIGGEMTLGKILVPCDFSDFSRSAVPVAADFCRKFGASLLLEHVVDTWLDYPEFAPQIEMNNSPHLAEAAQKSLDQLASEQEGVTVTARVQIGVPHRLIAETIEKENVDLVIMATHGRSGLAHVLLGSVTERLVRMSMCPLLTIHPNHQQVLDGALAQPVQSQQPPSELVS